jgi:hypothetical protein
VADLGAHLAHVAATVSGSANAAPRFWSNGWF